MVALPGELGLVAVAHLLDESRVLLLRTDVAGTREAVDLLVSVGRRDPLPWATHRPNYVPVVGCWCDQSHAVGFCRANDGLHGADTVARDTPLRINFGNHVSRGQDRVVHSFDIRVGPLKHPFAPLAPQESVQQLPILSLL